MSDDLWGDLPEEFWTSGDRSALPPPAGAPAEGPAIPSPPAADTPTAPEVDASATEQAVSPQPNPQPAVRSSVRSSRKTARRPGGARTKKKRRRLIGLPLWLWAFVGVAGVAAAAILLTRGDGDPTIAGDASAPVPTLATLPVVSSTVPIEITSPPATDDVAPSTVAPTPAPTFAAATSPPTTSPATGPPPTTIAVAPPSTVAPTPAPTTTLAPAPTTTLPPTTTSAPPPPPPTTTAPPVAPAPAPVSPTGPAVIIAGSQGPCRFGSDCLIAGFGIFGFPTQPTRFTCEFNDGSRYTYRFDTELIGYACATARRGGTITIEVEGVRSETLTRDAD